jgi:hypothetical protein
MVPQQPPDAGADPCCCNEENAMDLIRGPFVAAVKPAYDDPDDVLTYPKGYFQKDPQEPPTQINPDWVNGVQVELVSLISALGQTPASDVDNQLATACQQNGSFVPVFVDSVPTMAAKGFYARLGLLVVVSVEMSWDPASAPLAASPVRIKLPFVPLVALNGTGHVSVRSVFGAQGASFNMASAEIINGTCGSWGRVPHSRRPKWTWRTESPRTPSDPCSPRSST